MDEVMRAREEYFEAFGNDGPRPYGVSDKALVRELRAAVERGEPIPADFDWYTDVPPGAVV